MIMVKLLDKLFLIMFLFIYSCVSNRNEEKVNLSQGDERVGIWRGYIDSLYVEYEERYGYCGSLDSSLLQYKKYSKNNKIFLEIQYQYGWIKDLNIIDTTLTYLVMPFLDDRVGFDLYHTNCANCHYAFPDKASEKFINLINKQYYENKLYNFLHKEKYFKDDFLLFHPNFTNLDSIELKLIVNYLNSYNNKKPVH